ncbi:MAG: hypothetical protein KatS3mg102_0114 [Planctomycetota bacterium]|nr:MAG: hypothetical protein KatS3mg102_0114 [Planctomycetota bacterium]
MRARVALRLAAATVFMLGSATAAWAADALTPEDWRYGERMSYKDQFRKGDVKLWLATLFPADPSDEASAREVKEYRAILTRLFVLLHDAGVEFRRSHKRKDWQPWPWSTASVLSHGGKLLIAVRREAQLEPFTVMNWIFTGQASGTEPAEHPILKKKWWRYRRVVLGLEPYDTELEFDRKEPFAPHEVKVRRTDIQPDEGYWGMNLPIGGFGNPDARGQPVDDLGAHGHLLWHYRLAAADNPHWQVAYLLVLLPSPPAGYMKKDDWPKPHLHAAVHATDGGKPGGAVAVTGGALWADLKVADKPGERDCLRVVIADRQSWDAIVARAPELVHKEREVYKLLRGVPRAEDEGGED